MYKKNGFQNDAAGSYHEDDGDTPALNGDAGDLKKIEDLYSANHEREALLIIDRVLGLSKDFESNFKKLAELLKINDSPVVVKTDVFAINKERFGLNVHFKLGPKHVPHLLALRSKCYTALLDTTSGRSDPKLKIGAVANAELTLKLFPENPEFLIWVAQVLFLTGEVERAITLGKKAQSIDPENQMIKSTLEVFNRGNNADSFFELTHKALTLINSFREKCSAMQEGGPDGEKLMSADRKTMEILQKAGDMLYDSIEIYPKQAKAWAGLSWIYSMIGQKEKALGFFKEAQKIDPSDDLVINQASEFEKFGWTVEETIIGVNKGWKTAGGNSCRTGVASTSIRPPLSLSWTFDECGWIEGGIVVSGLTAVFGARNGKIYAVDIRKGTKLWEYTLGGILCGYLQIHNQQVFAGNSGYSISLDLASGKKIWESETNSKKNGFNLPIINSPLSIGEIIIFSDESLSILGVKKGEILFNDSSNFDPNTHTGPCANDKYVYIPDYKKMHRLNLSDGKFDQTTYTEGKIISGPVLADEYLLYGNNRSSVVAISTESFEVIWSFPVEGEVQHLGYLESRPAISNDRVFFGGPDGTFYALELSSGRKIWATSIGNFIASPPLISGDVVYILTDDGNFYALSATSGKILWQNNSNKKINSANCAPSPAGNQILIGWDRLYAYKSS